MFVGVNLSWVQEPLPCQTKETRVRWKSRRGACRVEGEKSQNLGLMNCVIQPGFQEVLELRRLCLIIWQLPLHEYANALTSGLWQQLGLWKSSSSKKRTQRVSSAFLLWLSQPVFEIKLPGNCLGKPSLWKFYWFLICYDQIKLWSERVQATKRQQWDTVFLYAKLFKVVQNIQRMRRKASKHVIYWVLMLKYVLKFDVG